MLSIASIYSALLYIAHSLYIFIQVLLNFSPYIKATLVKNSNGISNGRNESEFEYLNEKIKHLNKIPCHLLIILGFETPSYKDLANLAVWCEASGIQFVSFYDHNGVLKKTENQLLEAIKQSRNRNDRVKRANRDIFSKKIRVNVFTLLDGHRCIVEVTKECANNVKSSEVNAALVDERIRRRLHGLPLPELAIIFGSPCTTYGCLPWQIRFTELFNLKTHHDISLLTFLSTLQFYSRSQQRYGK